MFSKLKTVWGAILVLVIAWGAGATTERLFGEARTYGPRISAVEARVDTLTVLTWCMYDSVPKYKCPVHDGFRLRIMGVE